MSSEERKTVARRFFETQDELRGGPADELCADGYRACLAGFPAMDLYGHKSFSAGFYKAFPDLRHQVYDVLAEGNFAAVRFRLTGTDTGGFLGAPPSGHAVDIGALALLRIESGKVIDLHAQFDQLGLLQQLGMVPTITPMSA